MTESTDIERIRAAADSLTIALDWFHAAIRQARDAGISLRVIAEAAGLSHEQVRRIASR